MSDTVKLLRAMATGTDYIERKHDIILNAAADEIENLTEGMRAAMLYYDAVDILSDGPDDSDRAMAQAKFDEAHGIARGLFRSYGDLGRILKAARETKAEGLNAERGTGAKAVIGRSTP